MRRVAHLQPDVLRRVRAGDGFRSRPRSLVG